MSETKVCTKCGIEQPATTEYFNKGKNYKGGLKSECKKCLKSRTAQYTETNRTQLTKYAKNYYAKNKETINKRRSENNERAKLLYLKNKKQIAERSKQNYAKNKEHISELRKQWRDNNKEIIRTQKKQSYEANKEHVSEYKKANRDIYNIINQRHRANKNCLPSNYSKQQWGTVKQYFNNKCAYCGSFSLLEIEHVVPVSKGGSFTADNIIPACKKCNTSKHDYDIFEWYPKQSFYSEEREQAIIDYLTQNYHGEQITSSNTEVKNNHGEAVK